MLPRTPGRYETVSLLGEGGMGRVRKARVLENRRSLPRPTPEELADLRNAPLRKLERESTPPATGA